MRRATDRAALEGARAEIEGVASEFRDAAGPVLEAFLRRRLAALVRDRASWADHRRAEALGTAFDDAATRAIARGAADAVRRLADQSLWLEPMTAPGVERPDGAGWDGDLPVWLGGLLRRLWRRDRPSLGGLDDPGNRIWVALLSSARPLDPVLEEFGIPPSPAPDIGGGHHGLRPESAGRLDPSGGLERLWRRYRAAYERYAELSGSGGDGPRAAP
jgi:hypothetical protein